MNAPIPIAGGDGLAFENDNLPQRTVTADEIPDTGVGQPVDVATSQGGTGHKARTSVTDIDRANDGFNARRGSQDNGAYANQTFNKVVSHVVTHSLGREILYNWADAQFNVGGPGSGYPLDFGFGPGYHGDATVEQGNVQMYMKPGIYRRPTKGA